MLRVVTKLPRSKISERQRVIALRYHKSARHNAKNNPDYCPPEPGKSTGTGFLYTVGAIAVVGTATLGYAKYDPEFRKVLAQYAPFTDSMIKVMFNESGDGLGDFSIFGPIKEFITSLLESGEEGSGKTKRSAINETVPPYNAPKPAFDKLAKTTKEPEQTYTEIRLETKSKDAGEPAVEIVGIPKDTSEKETASTNPKSIAELETRISETAALAVEGYGKALIAIKKYNQEIQIFLDESVDHIQPEVWDALKRLTHEKNQTLKEADTLAKEVNKKLSQLKNVINSPELQAPADVKQMSLNNINKITRDINNAKKQLDEEKTNALSAEKYWKKVEESRRQFSDEIEILFPNANIHSKRLNIEEGELDLFVLHAVSKVLYYQKEMAKIETVTSERLRRAVDNAKRDGAEILTQEQICQELEKQKRHLEEEYSKKCLKLRLETERDMKNQLKMQSQAFHDHLEDAIKTRELEIEQKFGRSFDEKLMEERCKFKEQVAAMVGRLKGMDKALKERSDADKSAQQGQVLWSACQALFRSIKAGCPGLPWQDQLRPLKPEINAVVKAAAENDELVKAVIAGIPKEAKERGVYPEDALRERFIKVEKVARMLALVPEQGARLHMYMLSYLQSLLLLKAANPIPQAELNDEKVDFSTLNTNEILQRARYHLDRGDFAQTLRYMNLLKGASRAIARQWMEEARILLETQQAANTLMAHASASGLMYL